MKKEKLFIVIIAAVIAWLPSAARAGDDVSSGERSIPRWKSSLGEIQEAAAVLLETNGKLTAESNALKAQFDDLQARMAARSTLNAAAADEIARMRARSLGASAPQEVTRFKAALAERSRQGRAGQEELAALKARIGSAQGRVALFRLRLSGLEVDQKARAAEIRGQDEARLKALRSEIALIKERADKVRGQLNLMTQKIDELGRVDKPYLPQVRQLEAQNASLKASMAALEAQNKERQAKLDAAADQLGRAQVAGNMARVTQLLIERDAVQARLSENSEKLQGIKGEVVEPDSTPDLAADVEKLESQNAMMEEQLGNLRENIALLEYKVSTLQSYKDRNRSESPNRR